MSDRSENDTIADLTERCSRLETQLKVVQEKFSSIFESNPDSVMLTRIEDGRIVECNETFAREIGLPREKALRRTTIELSVWSGTEERDAYVKEVRRNGLVNKEMIVRRPDGVVRTYLYSSRIVAIGQEQLMLSVGRDITDLKKTEQALQQTNRALRLISLCNSAVVHADSEGKLLKDLCRIAVDTAGYRMAWVGRVENDEAKSVRPVTYAGPGKEFLAKIHVSWADNEYGHGTAGTAIRTRKPAIGRDLLHNPDFAAWRELFDARDFRSAVSVPLIVADEVFCVLLIYAIEPAAFDTTEINLLEELGRNISHGIMALRAGKERDKALVELEQARSELERKVALRTRELSEKNNELVREIELRRQTEETLRKSEEKYRELVENANSIILRMDTGGNVTFLNEFGQKFFGFTEDEIQGRNVVGSIVPETDSSGRDLEKMIHDIAKFPDAFIFNENENIRRNGERVWIAWANKPIFDTNGILTETLSVGNDITQLKEAERQLVRAKDAAEAADRIKSAFLATMSHELRTPLNSIIGFTGILLQELAGPLNPEQKKQLGMVQLSSRHLLSLINDVLDISKIEAGQLDVLHTPFNVHDAILKVVQETKPSADKKGLQVHLDIAPEVQTIRGDERRTEQVLMNLLNNSIKFTEHGEIRIVAGISGKSVRVSVRDTGIGIRPQDLGGLFQPFHQIDSGISRVHEGTGLGLSICKRLLDLMGGSIGVESEYGSGCVFTFTLPLDSERT